MSEAIHAPTRILVPVDMSEASRAGLRVAADIAARFGAHVTVLHVDLATATLGEMLAGTGGFPESSEVAERHLETTRAGLTKFVNETLAEGHEHHDVVVEGAVVAVAVLDFARERGMDWICMSAAGRAGWRRLFLGSTAAEIVRNSPIPVLTMRARDPESEDFVFDDFRRVLVATDLAEGAGKLVDMGALLATPHGSLTLMHVIEIPAEMGLYGVPLRIPGESLDAAREWSEAALAKLAAKLDPALVETPRVVVGRPAASVLQVEEELEPDVTIIGTHGRHGLDRLTLGSVAERIVRRATGPVLVVPTRQA